MRSQHDPLQSSPQHESFGVQHGGVSSPTTGVKTSKFKETLGISGTVVDWDGDLDLVLGGYDGRILVRLNEAGQGDRSLAPGAPQGNCRGALGNSQPAMLIEPLRRASESSHL